MNASNVSGRFDGQVAVVTGAASGIGRALALRLLAEGAMVWFWDQKVDGERSGTADAGQRTRWLQVDITDEAAVRNGFAQVCAKDGKIDIVINSAGIVGPTNCKTTETPAEGFERVLRVNLIGSFLITKHALVQMVPRKYGRILLIASIAGKEGNAGMCAYSSSKAGVIGLVKSAGKEFAETGITINALAPAVIRTAMVDGMDPNQVRYMTEKIPMKRCATLDEVASIGCYVVSREASFNTGFTFDLSGGRAVY